MKVPLSWLREYVDLELPAQELAHRLTMAGVEVGEIVEIGDWGECFVGQVMAVRPHPQADRLRLCQVTTGTEELEVVCGAPNVAAGQKICFAKVGARLFNTHNGKHEPLKEARIRGVVSRGMICSELELGLGNDQAGIIVLPEDAPLGTPLDQYLGDTILDLELTPNRLDCLSILGVAHEVAALTGASVREPDISYLEEGPPVSEQISVSVPDSDLCCRYTASLISGVKIGPSPHWLQERLSRAGQRPINNVVDVTNYVMLEYNQPLHAFDYDLLEDRTIIVRRAGPGETLVTLDSIERRLNTQVLVIADSHQPIGIGGVIGGANSEIGPGTTSVLLEAATFNGFNNRRTAQAFRLRTEATLRFEKGLRPELAPIALRRATQLIQQVAGGRVAQDIIDVFPGRGRLGQPVELTASRLKKVLGMAVDVETVERVLGCLGFQTKREGPDALEVTVPYWRNDIGIEDDLVEEVVRIIGYDSVPTTMLSTPIPYLQPDRRRQLREQVKDALAGAGMQEVISYPLISLDDLEKVNRLDAGNLPLRIANPLNAEQERLRPTLRPSLLGTLTANQGHGEGPFLLFEVGTVFEPQAGQLPDEQEMVAGVLAGRRWEPSWLNQPAGPPEALLDFYDVKGIVEGLLGNLGLAADYEPEEDLSFHPGRCACIMLDGVSLGVVGELHPAVRERFDLREQPVGFFELRLDTLLQALPEGERVFASVSRYPAATRDLALVIPADVPAGKVQSIISRHRLVTGVDLFDIYTGDNIASGTKSLAFHVCFQAHNRTLTTEEVNRSLQGLLRTLEREVQASLRS
jgi:phenylalanyl-tRNA synthetase beta chain